MKACQWKDNLRQLLPCKILDQLETKQVVFTWKSWPALLIRVPIPVLGKIQSRGNVPVVVTVGESTVFNWVRVVFDKPQDPVDSFVRITVTRLIVEPATLPTTDQKQCNENCLHITVLLSTCYSVLRTGHYCSCNGHQWSSRVEYPYGIVNEEFQYWLGASKSWSNPTWYPARPTTKNSKETVHKVAVTIFQRTYRVTCIMVWIISA